MSNGPAFDPDLFPARNPSRKCKKSDWERLDTPVAPKRTVISCPHTTLPVRSSRELRRQQCNICQENYFNALEDGQEVVPVKIGCGHVFCRSCLETLRSHGLKCPWQWCTVQLDLQPDDCKLCEYWLRAQGSPSVVTIRASEMSASIKKALTELSNDDDFYELSKQTTRDFLAHIRTTLRRFEWQFHTGTDLAELLDPFLVATDLEAVREYYGKDLAKPVAEPSAFPPRENDPDDYPAGQEPWIAAFLRRWALDYEKEHGETREGWGEWARKARADNPDSWDWMFKRIVAHRTEADGSTKYLVKWIGKRFGDSWIGREQMGDEAIWKQYDGAHGVGQPGRVEEVAQPTTKGKKGNKRTR